MSSPYTAAFFLRNFIQFVQPLPSFISWIVWFTILRFVEIFLSPARQFDLLTCGIAGCLGFGVVVWKWAAVEFLMLYIVRALPIPFVGFLSTSIALEVVFTTLKNAAGAYFLFQGTDEANLGLVMECARPMIALVMVTAVSVFFRLAWNHLGLFLATSVILTLFATEPRMREYLPTKWTGMALWFVVKWFLRFYFFASDWIAETTHSSLRHLETWESSISKNLMAALRPYTYRPLDPLKREIRILRLRRRTAFPDIVCDFICTTVDKTPPFEAISYTWGGESMTENIVIDGARVAVTPTVSRWLRYRRSFFSEAYLWIDAVCIDQANKDEKSAQIPLMGDIYSKADRTAVWLTHPADVTCRQANGARTLLMTLNALHMSGATTENLQYMLQDKSTPYLQRLLAQPYFHRIWVIQEIALAKQVHLFYGTVTMNWDALAYAASVLHDGRLVGSMLQARASSNKRDSAMTNVWSTHISNMANIAQIRRACLEGVKMEFSNSLAKTGSFTATVPHDNLFGLLGLVDDLPESIMQPDYSEPLEKLYTRTTRHILEKPSKVSLLQLAGSGFLGAAHQQGLPSWVPDFSHRFNRRRTVYDDNSSIIRDTQARENPDWNVLDVEFSIIDTISTVQTRTFTLFNQIQPVWEHDLKELESYPADSSSDTLAHQRDQLQSLIDWFDEANTMAQDNPATTAHYPEDLDLAVTRTLCCNSPDDIQDTADGTLGAERSRMTMNVTRIMCQVYQENIDSTVQELNARIMELCGLTEEEWISVVSPEMNHFFFYLGATAGGKSFCILESGRMAMVPLGSRRGDSVAYIRGQRIPFVVRRAAEQDGFYDLVGGCYVHGIPDVPSIFSLPDMKWHEASIV